ncbi:MAG TPA: FAD binding domain-containing protein [Thermoleophilaceae bacterium]
MKPAPFEYAAPRSVDEALGLLGEDSKALAGGQSLVPLLNFRFARPELLVDLNRVSELSYIRRSGGVLHIGALTRQATLERSGVVWQHWPLLAQAVRHAGHPQTRSRGTVGGSAVHADPTAELPVALTALDARFHLSSARGRRTLTAPEFFVATLISAVEPDELLVEVEVPALPEGARTAFVEYQRTHGDFAVAGAAVVRGPGDGSAIALLGAGTTPVRAHEAERALTAGAGAREAAELAAGALTDGWRRALTTELVREAIERAAA